MAWSLIKQADAGSSPRVWGTRNSCFAWQSNERFIPTCVGNTCAGHDGACQHAVHPHVCGEHADGDITDVGIAGSSPRVWGTRYPVHAKRINKRFIPTCVGNTTASSQPLLTPTVHPHVCGEHSGKTTAARVCSGSSPRVWGTRYGKAAIHALLRFIPTCVGNTRAPDEGDDDRTVHPHVCGEHVE